MSGSVELASNFRLVCPGSAELLGNAEIQQLTSAELLGKFEAQATAELLGKVEIQQSGSAELLSRFEAQAIAQLLGKAVIRHPGTPIELLGKFDVGQDSAELLGEFEAQATAELLVRVEVRGLDSTELLGKAVIRQEGTPVELLGNVVIRHTGTPIELLGKFEVGQDSAELLGEFEAQAIAQLLGKAVIRHPGTPIELLGNVEVQQSGSTELLGNAVIKHAGTPVELLGETIIRHSASAELLGNGIIRHSASAELLGNGIIRHSASTELLGNTVIRHTGTPRELFARCVIRHTATRDLDANVIINHWKDMYGKAIIRHTATPLNLPAIFWARWPTRLWTSRRYINGVIELDEKLLGDASLEYVIEGVMEDTQGYLDNAGLPYSDWTNLTLVPVQILRAVTYGTVAALYARHTQTFRGQVIPSITPVTVTVIGDAEKAMNYWEDRTNQMLEFYVTSQGGDVMLTSTPDEEPVFSMEDIPEEVTEFVSWRIWLQERNGS